MFTISCSNTESDGYSFESDSLSGISRGKVPGNPTDTISYILSQTSGIGAIHNECMDSIVSEQLEISDLNDYTYGFSVRRNLVSNSPTAYQSFTLGTAALLYDQNGNMLTLDSLSRLDNMVLPSGWGTYVRSIGEAIDISDAKIAKATLNSLKNGILNDSSLDVLSKSALVGAVEVAVASYDYNVVEDSYGINNQQVLKSIARSDVRGAVQTVVISAFSGKYAGMLVFGPQGVVVSVVQDATIGAMKTSAQALVSSLLEWI